MKVLCITADGASSNRKFFRMHYNKKDPQTFHKTRNIYSTDNRWLYFISDPPHLLKTVRNCWSHSGKDGTRHMKVKYYIYLNGVLALLVSLLQLHDQYIEWEQLKQLHSKLTATTHSSQGLSLVPKLKREHLELTSFSRMRVDLAAQVFEV